MTLPRLLVLGAALLCGAVISATSGAGMAEDEARDPERLLAETVDVEFVHTPVDQVLRFLSEARPGLRFVTSELESRVNMPAVRVTMRLRGAPVRRALALALPEDVVVEVRGGAVHLKARRDRPQESLPGFAEVDRERLVEASAEARRLLTEPDLRPSQPVVPVEPLRPATRVQRLLETPVTVDFEDTPLPQALAKLLDACPELDLVVDASLVEAGIDLAGRKVTLHLADVPLAEVFRAVLGRHLVAVARPEFVHIMLCADVGRTCRPVLYPVADLLSAMMQVDPLRRWAVYEARWGQIAHRIRGSLDLISRDGPRGPDIPLAETYAAEQAKQLRDLLQRLVNSSADRRVAAWTVEGGFATIEYRSGVLIVLQSREGQRRIAQLLTLLRKAEVEVQRQLDAPAPAETQPQFTSEGFARADPAAGVLDTSVTAAFEEASLPEAVSDLARQSGLRVSVAPPVAERGGVPEKTVTLAVHEVPLAEVLDLILPEWLAAVPRGGSLVLLERGRESRLTTGIYPVADLLTQAEKVARETGEAGLQPEDLLEVVKWTVDYRRGRRRGAWADEGGPAGIEYLGGAFIMSQTLAAHRGVLAVLQALRRGSRLVWDGAEGNTTEAPAISLLRRDDAEAVRRRLAEPVSVDFQGATVPAAVEYLRDFGPYQNIVLHPKGEEVLSADERLWVGGEGVPLSQVLAWVAGEALAVDVRPNLVVLKPRHLDKAGLRHVLYPVGDLAFRWPSLARDDADAGEGRGDRKGDGADDADGPGPARAARLPDIEVVPGVERIEEAVKVFAGPAVEPGARAWAADGGPAGVAGVLGMLLVRQSGAGHRRISNLLARLRQARDAAPGEPLGPWMEAQVVDPPCRRRAREAVRHTVRPTLTNAPRREALAELDRQCPAIRICFAHLNALALKDPVFQNAEPQTAKVALEHVLGSNFIWAPAPAGIVVKGGADPRFDLYTAVYPLPEIVPAIGRWRRLRARGEATFRRDPERHLVLDPLREAVTPGGDHPVGPVAPWSDASEAGRVMLVGRALLLRQTRRGHQKAVEFLERLRPRLVGAEVASPE